MLREKLQHPLRRLWHDDIVQRWPRGCTVERSLGVLPLMQFEQPLLAQ